MEQEFEINFESRGNTYFRHESSIAFDINGETYWFTMIEEGCDMTAPEENNVEFETDEDLPFELTEEMKDYMYNLACTN